MSHQQAFIEYALACDVLKFGEFTLKSGRTSPYFFNAGLFNTGQRLQTLGQFYAQALIASGLHVDIFYGPAYKGIPLATAMASAYALLGGRDMPYAFNRKEIKDHGEGGLLVGAELKGRVLIVDDVITAGTSVRESVEIIQSVGAEPVGVIIALNRQEKGADNRSAIQEVSTRYGIPVIAIICLADIVDYLTKSNDTTHLAAIKAYQFQYGCSI